MKHKYLIPGLLLLIALALAACTNPPEPTAVQQPQPTQVPCPTAGPAVECPTPPEPVVQDVPFEEMWVNSPHADLTSEAFVHWDEEETKEVPANCAKCHSTTGYLDFLGEDGSAAGTVDNPAPIGTVVTCAACHNASTASMTSVVFPSGIEVAGLGSEARCMQCHQGRASIVQVDGAIERNGLTEDLDTASPDLGFVNIHYYAAAATIYGTEAKGGYEYAGKMYDARFEHAPGFDTCVGCHNSHSLELKVDQCAACHQDVTSREDLKNIRMEGSLVDYDGDGDIEEGIAFEIEGLQEMLLQAIQAYGSEVAGTPIIYSSAAYPYFFADTNADGQAGDDEVVSANGYKSWTGRLLKAAYNYQTSLKDPGGYAHGGKYIIELLYDSIEDLNTAISTPVDLTAANRIDAGHFAGSTEAFRHWDQEESGKIPATCAKCHTADGLPFTMAEGVSISMHPSNGLNCGTCHDDLTTFSRFIVPEVRFPSGAALTFDDADSNLCLNCHQGRVAKTNVDRVITTAGVSDDEISEQLSFQNPHYFAAGATLFGSEASGAYEFEGQEYNGRFVHVAGFDTCIECHEPHALTVNTQACSTCHSGVNSEAGLEGIRMVAGDFDGDGDETEGLAGEIETMHEALYAAIQTYAAETASVPILYNNARHPYFFADPNGNGELDEGEGRYTSWTPTLLRAAYNYQWVAKDPGAFAHNGHYIIQVLYDSLQSIGVDVSNMIRPEVK